MFITFHHRTHIHTLLGDILGHSLRSLGFFSGFRNPIMADRTGLDTCGVCRDIIPITIGLRQTEARIIECELCRSKFHTSCLLTVAATALAREQCSKFGAEISMFKQRFLWQSSTLSCGIAGHCARRNITLSLQSSLTRFERLKGIFVKPIGLYFLFFVMVTLSLATNTVDQAVTWWASGVYETSLVADTFTTSFTLLTLIYFINRRALKDSALTAGYLSFEVLYRLALGLILPTQMIYIIDKSAGKYPTAGAFYTVVALVHRHLPWQDVITHAFLMRNISIAIFGMTLYLAWRNLKLPNALVAGVLPLLSLYYGVFLVELVDKFGVSPFLPSWFPAPDLTFYIITVAYFMWAFFQRSIHTFWLLQTEFEEPFALTYTVTRDQQTIQITSQVNVNYGTGSVRLAVD